MINSAQTGRDTAIIRRVATENATEELLTRLVFKFARSLGAMRSTTQALLNGGDEDRLFRREMLGEMDQELRELQRLIDNVVQFRALSAGTFQLQTRTILPSLVLWRTVDAWQTAGSAKLLDWRVDIPEELDPLVVDSDKLQQVLDNVLANVVRDSPRGSQVIIRVGISDGTLEFRVESDASRVGEEEYEHLFELFYTGLQQGRFPTGTGLGLHVARELAQAHGGDLELHRPPPGGGSMMWILRLPLARGSNGSGSPASR
jgi:signal transduction histidine kinase